MTSLGKSIEPKGYPLSYILPKNRLTTHQLVRSARRAYRSKIRPPLRVTVGNIRMKWLEGNPPSYLIVGAQKAGTTGLHDALLQLPDFGKPFRKEIHYFDRFSTQSLEWYFSHFAGDSKQIWGEATPEYLDLPSVAAVVRAVLPNVRIVVSLRDPVSRAVSHYHHARDMGLERRPLLTALRWEAERVATGWSSDREKLRFGYVTRSRYSRSLRYWFDEFDRSQVLLTIAERRGEALHNALEFLGVAPQAPGVIASQRSSNMRSYRQPDATALEFLRSSLADEYQSLATVAGWPAVPQEWNTVEEA